MIPNRFHFVFGLKRQTEPFHLIHYLCLKSCIEVNHPDAIYFYYRFEPYGRYWEQIREQLVLVAVPPNEFVERFVYRDREIGKYRYAHASDFLRLERVVAQGGVYADMDTLFVNPIPQGLYEKTFVLGREDEVPDKATNQYYPSLCNAVIMAERNALFGRMWLDEMERAFDGTWSKHSTLLPDRLAREYPELVHIEAARTFYKYMWTREGVETLLEGRDTDLEGVVSMHLWEHLWWSRWRREFSTVHAGQMTEERIRTTDTTYTLAARRFLPPPDEKRTHVGQSRGQRALWTKGKAVAREGVMRVYILAKLATFKVVDERITPRAAEHLDYAQRQWAHPYVRTRFQARNRYEQQAVIDSVALWDEYGMEGRSLKPEDVVLDIGAHVGVFSYECYLSGSRRVYCYEPELGNFRQLAQHIGGLAGIYPRHLGVFRSDRRERVRLTHSGYLGMNTGAGNVLMGGRLMDVNTQVVQSSDAPQRIEVAPLDEILEAIGQVRLMKLDCEGSEFPILLTSRRLGQVAEIIGEFHEVSEAVYAELDPQAQVEGYRAFHAEDLRVSLEQAGFCVEITPTAPFMGKFRATRVAVDGVNKV